MDWEAQPALRRQPLLEGGEAADSSLSRSDLRPSFSRAFPGKARSLSSGIRLTPCPGLRRFLWTWTEETAAATPLHPLPTIAATLERAAPQSRQPHPPHQPLHVLADVPSRAILRPLFRPAPAPIRSDGGRLPENEGGGEPAPKETVLKGSPWKLYFVQCSQCGGVVGVLDDQNIGRMLQQRNPALKEIPATQEVSVILEPERL